VILTTLLVAQAPVDDCEPPTVERGPGLDGGEEQHQEHDMAGHLPVLYPAGRPMAMGGGLFRLRMAC
jgi:hypothetical protein